MSNALISIIELCVVVMFMTSARKIFISPLGIMQSSETGIIGILANRFSQAGLFYDEKTVKSLLIMVAAVSMLFGLVISPLLTLVAPLVSLTSVWLYLGSVARTKQHKALLVNDEICYFFARSLRAGHSLESSIMQVHKVFTGSVAISEITRRMRAGICLSAAVKNMSTSDRQDLSTSERMLCATISLAQEMGGNSARIFERIGDSFHQSYDLQEETSSSLAQVRMSAIVIGALPVVMVGFSLLFGSNSTTFLFTQPLGWVCLVTGLLLELIGVLWMKKLVRNGVKVWTS